VKLLGCFAVPVDQTLIPFLAIFRTHENEDGREQLASGLSHVDAG
jgi:hypothetical protein